MKVLLLGSSGFISSCTETRLSRAGHEVTVLGRRGLKAQPRSRAVRGDRADTALLKELAARHFDAVVDFLCYDAVGAGQVVAAFASHAARCVSISTGSVYWCTGEWINPVDETQFLPGGTANRPPPAAGPPVPMAPPAKRLPSPFEPGSVEYAYGAGKRAAEEFLWAASCAGEISSVCLRFPVVSGPGDPTGRYAGYLARLEDGGPILLPAGGYNSFRHLYVEDAAAAIEAALDLEVPAGAFNVCSREIVSVRDLVKQMADLTGRPRPQVVEVSERFLERQGMQRLFAPFTCGRDQILDPSRGLKVLGLTPTPYGKWLGTTLEVLTKEAGRAAAAGTTRWCSRQEERAFMKRCEKELAVM